MGRGAGTIISATLAGPRRAELRDQLGQSHCGPVLFQYTVHGACKPVKRKKVEE